MSDYIERMKIELTELTEKTVKLDEFVHTDSFYRLTGDARSDLERQLWIMRDYRKVLSERLAKANGIKLSYGRDGCNTESSHGGQ